MPKVLIIIPAYNEGTRINEIVRNVREMHPDYDVVVINDGSKDDTALKAHSAGAIVVSHPFNLGYGVAI
ncbi:MAG: glycosyltransferase, partial [Deltaproteobacteria bacterium]|nr:glycosyltransferase [Deltaproteobacteria bacterium]